MSSQRSRLELGIATLEAQRSLLGNAVVDAAIAALRAQQPADEAPTEPPAAAAPALRQVSILFLDLVGSTSLSQRLDPESVSEVMDDALSRGTEIVSAHQGKVLQYAGDNILAAFGADASQEDDAERAVHCGLALLALGRTLESEVLAAHGHGGFGVRVGVHTGGVLLGAGVAADGSIRGSAVNIAARMEQTAPPGGLRISHDTYALVRGLFEVQAQPPLSVKGVDEPVSSYLVVRAKPRSFRIGTRGLEGVVTRMVGRDAEFAALKRHFENLFRTRRLAAVTVVADAGLGKSRLLYEFQAWSEARPERFYLFRGRATPQSATQAFGLLRDLVAWRFQIADDDRVEVARQKMTDGIVPLFVHDDGPDLAEAHAHLLGHLIGIDWRDSRHIKGILDDPRQIRDRALHTAAQFIRRLCAKGGIPAVVLLEDLHWADDESLDFLNHLATVNRDVPLLLLAFTRPTLFERRTDWRSTEGVHERIDLQPLGPAGSRELVAELLHRLPEVPAVLGDLLARSAGGVPFYMEELVRMLIDQGAIRTGSAAGEPWSLDAGRLELTRVPPTLTGVLQARLDGLPAAERIALQQASIVGAVFWDRALSAVSEPAAGQLPALARRELTLPRPDAPLDGLREYAFRHHILHQVTYATVLRRDKREGHARVGRWLASVTAQGSLRAGDFLGLAAEHFERAGDADQAAEFHARAAEQAGERQAHERVMAHVGRALALLGEATAASSERLRLRWRLHWVRERTLALQAHRADQATELDAMSEVAEALSDDRLRALVAWRRCMRALRMADWATQEAAARHGIECATRAGDEALRLQSVRLLASSRVRQGDIEGGRRLALQGLDDARRLGLREIEGRLLNVLSIAAERQGDLVSPLRLKQQSLPIFREFGDRVNEAILLLNLGGNWLSLGDRVQARRDLEASLQLLRANGDRVMEAAALSNLSTLALRDGDAAGARALALQVLDITRATQARAHGVGACVRLGDAELALGDAQAAHEAYTLAREGALAVGIPGQYDASAGLAEVALSVGDTAAALAAIGPVLQHVEQGGSLDGAREHRVRRVCLQVLQRAGDPRADAWIARAQAALQAQADAISDPALRQGFLLGISCHREILAARPSGVANA